MTEIKNVRLIFKVWTLYFLIRCIVRALKDPTTFLFDHLLALKPVKFLEGELIHDVSIQILIVEVKYSPG